MARLAHTYGPGMSVDDGRVQADFLGDVINDRNIVMKSEGKPIRTYTYVSDAVAAIFRILLDSDEMVYNISSPESTVSIRQLAETLADAYEDRGIQVVMDLPKETKDTGEMCIRDSACCILKKFYGNVSDVFPFEVLLEV